MINTRLRVGGVMRCCAESLNVAQPESPKDGDKIPCKWCSEALVFKDGAWEWDNTRESSSK